MLRVVVFLLALAFGSPWALADRYSDCNQTKNLDRRIRGCTQVIKRGKQETIKNRSYAYNNRGNAYRSKKDYDRAIADYSQAIKLNPKYASAYNGRGNAYDDMGQYDRAITNFVPEHYQRVVATFSTNAYSGAGS